MFFNNKIIFIDKTNEKDDFFCKICNYPLVTKDDFSANKEFNCCHYCYLQFAEARRKEWLSGWRPSKEDLSTYLKERKQFSEKIIKI
jgi:hypothetical protein